MSSGCELFVQNFERRAIATARHLTQRSKQMVSSVALPLDNLSVMLQPVRDVVTTSVADPTGVSIDTVQIVVLLQTLTSNSGSGQFPNILNLAE